MTYFTKQSVRLQSTYKAIIFKAWNTHELPKPFLFMPSIIFCDSCITFHYAKYALACFATMPKMFKGNSFQTYMLVNTIKAQIRHIVSNHQHHGCLLKRLFRHRWKKTSKLRVTGLCVGNSPVPVNSPHKGPVTRKMFPSDDVIMFRRATRFPESSPVLLNDVMLSSICFR